MNLGRSALSGSFYTSPNGPNVRTLKGHIDILLTKHPSRGHVAKEAFGTGRGRESGPIALNTLWPPQLIAFSFSCRVFALRRVP